MMKDLLADSLFHSTKGRYFSDTRVVGLDFIANLFRSGDSTSTLIHETVHAFDVRLDGWIIAIIPRFGDN